MSTKKRQPKKPVEVTQLNPIEEHIFQWWAQRLGIPDVDSLLSKYDYRGAFKAGILPDSSGHWPDTFKQHGHLLFSDESQYANPLDKNRRWFGSGDAEVLAPMRVAEPDATRVASRRRKRP